MRVFTLDNTFGYNPGRADLPFSLADKMTIVGELDRLGIDYVDGGSPGADQRAAEFFARAHHECVLRHASLVASARLDAIRESLARDTGIQSVVDAGTPAVALSSCYWHAGPIGLQEHCRRIAETVRYFKSTPVRHLPRV